MSTQSERTPRVSVLIPVYGTASFVAETLDSVLSQTYTDYEIIVVNDGSPDSMILEEILEPYRRQITYIVQENRGASGARNTALRVARSEYVAMLDSDDRWHPDYLASQLAYLDAHPTVDVVYTDVFLFSSDKIGTERWSDTYPVGGEISFLRVLARECQIYMGVTARRELLLRVGLYDEDLKSGEDFELWLRVLKAGGRIAYNDRALVYYRLREGSLTSMEVQLAENVLRALDKVEKKMALTVHERAALDNQRAVVTARLRLSEGRQAFISGDFRTAIGKLTDVAGYSNGWKLRATIAALRTAPSILLWFYELRGRWRNRRRSSEDRAANA